MGSLLVMTTNKIPDESRRIFRPMDLDESRSFVELLRNIGYRDILIDDAGNIGFPIVSDIMGWMISMLDPDAMVPELSDTYQGRMTFISTIAKVCTTYRM